MNIDNAASTLRRFLGFLLDAAILTYPSAIIIYIVTGKYDFLFTREFSWTLIVVFYFTVVPLLWGGSTIGKRALRVKIQRVDGGNVKLSNMIMREVVGRQLLAFLTFGLSIGISFFMVMFREDKRAIHDFIGGTYVINIERT